MPCTPSPSRDHRDRPRPSSPRRPQPTTRVATVTYRLRHLLSALVVVAFVLTVLVVVRPGAAYAADTAIPLAADSIQAVVNNIRNWLVGILVAVATLFLTVGALRYLAANGDPAEVEKGKLALKSAAIGYALALLAPLFVTVVGQWVA